MHLNISDIELSELGQCFEIKGHVGFQTLWFRLPCKFEPDRHDASPFVISALIPAMLLGQDIHVDQKYFVSTQLLSQLNEIQDIYHYWNPSFKKVQIYARSAISATYDRGSGLFFSGGVDGAYSLIKHGSELNFLILINGFDFGMGNTTWSQMVARTQLTAKKYDKTLLAVETNFKTFILNYGIARIVNYNTCLAAIGLLIGLDKVIISAANTYNLIKPDGCHPLIDYKYSTENTQFIHSGLEADRAEKLSYLKQHPSVLENLWVCWRDPRYNCGKCSKCVRTYIALLLTQTTDLVPFHNSVEITQLAKQTITSDNDYDFFLGFKALAERQGHQAILIMINKLIFRYKLKKFLADCDHYLMKGVIANWRRKRLGEKDLNVKVGLQYRYSDSHNIERISTYRAMSDITENDSIVGSIYFNNVELEHDTASEMLSEQPTIASN